MNMNILLDEAFELKSQLNPSLFKNNILKDDVRDALIKIADTFVEELKDNGVPLNVVDYWFLGSNAAYNYNEYSDVDIHIIVNTENLDCDKNIINLLYNYAKASFNKSHNITVKGYKVELYIEDMESTSIANGIYSLKYNTWVKEPLEPLNKFSFDFENSELYLNLKDILDTIESKEEINAFIDNLYLIRKAGLTKDGELGEGNLIFKQLRNEGVLDDLKDKLIKLEDQELTLEGLKNV